MAKATAQLPDIVQAHDDPRYRAAWDKLQSVRSRLEQADRRIEAEHARMASRRHSTRHIDAAHALVYDELAPSADAAGEDLRALEEDRRVLRAAIEIAERRVRDVEGEVSREIIDACWPEYRQLVVRQHAAAAALVAVCDEERRFVAALRDGGTSLGRLQRVLWPRATAEELARHGAEALHCFDLAL